LTLLVFVKDALGQTMSAEISSGALYDMSAGEWREAERKWKGVGQLWTQSIRSGAFVVPVAADGSRKQCGEAGEQALQPAPAGGIMSPRG